MICVSPLAGEEAEADVPSAVVDVGVDEDEALPDAELWLPAEDGDRHCRTDEDGEDVVSSVPRRPVAMLVATFTGEQSVDGPGEIALTARSCLHQTDSGGGVRDEDIHEAVAHLQAEPVQLLGEVGHELSPSLHVDFGALHGLSLMAGRVSAARPATKQDRMNEKTCK
jgi:hypothetical protein